MANYGTGVGYGFLQIEKVAEVQTGISGKKDHGRWRAMRRVQGQARLHRAP